MKMPRFVLCSMLFAAVCLSTVAYATPSVAFVDNLDGSITLQLTPTGGGSVATETAVSVSVPNTINITGVSIGDPSVFDTSNPGNNPFTGTVTFGLWQSGNDVFASYGSVVLGSSTPVDFLDISYTGSGTFEATALIAEFGAIVPLQFASITVGGGEIPEPASALMLGIGGLATLTGRRNRS